MAGTQQEIDDLTNLADGFSAVADGLITDLDAVFGEAAERLGDMVSGGRGVEFVEAVDMAAVEIRSELLAGADDIHDRIRNYVWGLSDAINGTGSSGAGGGATGTGSGSGKAGGPVSVPDALDEIRGDLSRYPNDGFDTGTSKRVAAIKALRVQQTGNNINLCSEAIGEEHGLRLIRSLAANAGKPDPGSMNWVCGDDLTQAEADALVMTPGTCWDHAIIFEGSRVVNMMYWDGQHLVVAECKGGPGSKLGKAAKVKHSATRREAWWQCTKDYSEQKAHQMRTDKSSSPGKKVAGKLFWEAIGDGEVLSLLASEVAGYKMITESGWNQDAHAEHKNAKNRWVLTRSGTKPGFDDFDPETKKKVVT